MGTLEEEMEITKVDTDTLTSKSKQLKSSLGKHDKELKSLESELKSIDKSGTDVAKDFNKNIEIIKTQIKDLKNEMASKHKTIDDLRINIDQFEQEIKEKEKLLQRLRGEVDGFQDNDLLNQSSHSALNEELTKIKTDRSHVDSDLKTFESKYNKLRDEVRKLRDQYDNSYSEMENYRKYDDLNSSIEPKLQAIKEYTSAKKSIDKESIKLNKKLNELESTRNSLDKTIDNLLREKERLIEENDLLMQKQKIIQYSITIEGDPKKTSELKVSQTIDSDDALIEEPEEDVQDIERLKHLLLEERRKKYQVDEKISKMEKRIGRYVKEPSNIDFGESVSPRYSGSVRHTIKTTRRGSEITSPGKQRRTVRYIRREVPQTISTTKHLRRLSNVDQDTVRDGTQFLSRQGSEREFKSPQVPAKRKRSVDVNDGPTKKRRV